MTIWITQQLPLFNFERHNILFFWIGHPSQKLLSFEFAFCFHVWFRASRYILRLNQTSEWKIITIWLSQEHLMFNFERLDILLAGIGHPNKKLWAFKFAMFQCIISSISIYYALNRTSELKAMTIWISRLLPFFNFECHNILLAWIGHPSQKLLPFEFALCFHVWFRASRYIIRLDRHPSKKLWPFQFLESFRCSISSIIIYYWPESDIRVKRYCRLNLPSASMFNFEHLDILCAWIGHPSEKLWPFDFLESFHCLILSVSIYCWPGLDIQVKSYLCLNLSCASMFNFEHLHILCA